MKKLYTMNGSAYFNGVKISDSEIKGGYISWRTLTQGFNMILCNDITSLFYGTINGDYIEPELINGYDEEEEEEAGDYIEVYQYYIISESDADIITEYTNAPLYYIESLNMYILGVTFYGLAWDLVPAAKIEYIEY